MAREILLDGHRLELLRERTVQRDNEVPSEPVQRGESISDNIQTKPRIWDFVVKITGDTEEEVNSELQRLKQFRNSRDTHRLNTPEDQVDHVAVQKIQDQRSLDQGLGYRVRMTLKEIIFTDAGNSQEARSGTEEAEEVEKDAGRKSNNQVDEDEADEDRRVIFLPGIDG